MPLIVAGWPASKIAEHFGKSVQQTKRYIADPEVQAKLREIDAHRLAETKERAVDLAQKAWDALEACLGSEDERIVLDAAKTVLDRKGYPATSKTDNRHEHDVAVPQDRDALRARLRRAMDRLDAADAPRIASGVDGGSDDDPA